MQLLLIEMMDVTEEAYLVEEGPELSLDMWNFRSFLNI